MELVNHKWLKANKSMSMSKLPAVLLFAILGCHGVVSGGTPTSTVDLSVPSSWRGPLPLYVEWRVLLSIEGEGRVSYLAELTRTRTSTSLIIRTATPGTPKASLEGARVSELGDAFQRLTLEAAPPGAVIFDGSKVHLFYESAGGTWYRLDFGVAGPSRPNLPAVERWALDLDAEVQEWIRDRGTVDK